MPNRPAGTGIVSETKLADYVTTAIAAATVTPTAPPTYTYGLGRFLGAVRRRNSRAILIIAHGSSTTAGDNASTPANRYVNKLIAALQSKWPLSSGSSPAVRTLAEAVTAVASAPLTPGLQLVNNGKGGTESADFISTADINNYAAIAPATGLTIFHHMAWSNDWSHGIPPVVTKANIAAKMSQITAAMGAKPHIHVLVHTYGRVDSSATGSIVASWAEYGAKIKELAAENPSNVVFFDLTPTYLSAGVPGADPFGLIDHVTTPVDVHQTNEGHDLMAEVLYELYTSVPAPLALSATPTVTNTAAPAITGTVQAGQTLTVSNGAWTPTPTSYTRQWYRSGTAISGATGASYVLTTADDGQSINAIVTATAAGFANGTAASNTVNPISATTISSTAAPTITGGNTVGEQATATTGSWTNSPTGFAYQWYRTGTAISGATSSTYTPVTADGDTTLTVVVTGSRSGYTSGTATSAGKSVSAPLPGTVFTSDSFTGTAGSLSSTSTDAALGGTAKSYGTIPGSLFQRDGNGNLTVNASGTPTPGHAAIDVGTADQHHTLDIGPLSAASFWIDFRKATTVVSAATYRLQLAPATGTAYLVARTSGSVTIGASIAVDFTVGHVFMVSIVGSTLKWWLDGVLVDTVTGNTAITTGTVGSLTTTTAAVTSVKSWTVRAL